MTATDFQQILSSPTRTYEEGLAFFMGTGVLNNTLRRVASDMERLGINYNVIGAVALNQHGYRRFTEDIDLLLTEEGLRDFQDKLIGAGDRPAFEGAKKRFRTAPENMTVEIITTGEYPGDGLPKPVVFPAPEDHYVVIDGIKTISLEKLVELKLASGLSAPERLKDLADVQELIKVKAMEADFAEKLNPSVRDKFVELHQAVARARERERGTLTE
ncbi:MAG: hypothetical protein M3430_03290 [Acidobacteriota bacterium]|nr:hypothetical protein [Acidobacteriota bacterium]